ncbi:MAG: YhbY family RNA-binding protein [Limisphaerales bacterium]
MEKITGSELRRLKGAAQLLDPVIKLGRAGITPGLVQALDQALRDHGLVKVRFDAFTDQRRELARELAERTATQIILQVGHVVSLYRRRPAQETPNSPPP